MKKIAFLTILAFFLTMSSAASASAFSLVVNKTSPSCIGGRDYYSSIQDAVYEAAIGDTIIACPGIYSETVDIFTSLNIYSYSGMNDTIISSPQNSAQYSVRIAAENVNFSGFTIKHNGTKEKLVSNAGIYIKTKNARVSDSAIETTGALNYGLFLNLSANSAIENTTIKTDGSGGIGIYLSESTGVMISNNAVSTSGSYAHAVYLYSSPESNISYSKISTSGTNAYGTALYSSKDISLENSAIATSGENAFGIYTEIGENSNILKNNITTLGGWAMGIYFRPNSNSRISGNTIRTSGAFGWGIYLLGGSSNSTISENFIKTSGESAHGIYLLSHSDFNRITSNTIETNLTPSSNSWALKVDISSDNVFSRNIISGDEQKVNHSFAYSGNVMVRGVAGEEKYEVNDSYADMDRRLSISFSGFGFIYLNVSYTDEEADFVDESTLALYRQKDRNFEKLRSRVNQEENYVYADFHEAGIFALLANAAAKKSGEIAVFANSIDKAMAGDFFSFLRSRGMQVSIFNASDFEKEKTRKIIVILGGPDAYEGIGEIVRSLVNESEQSYLRVKGNRKMLAAGNRFSDGQRVFVISGSDRHETAKARAENKHHLLETVNLI